MILPASRIAHGPCDDATRECGNLRMLDAVRIRMGHMHGNREHFVRIQSGRPLVVGNVLVLELGLYGYAVFLVAPP